MRIRKEHEFLFSQKGAQKWLTRSRLPKPAAVLPLSLKINPEINSENFLFSTDARCLRLTESLRERFNREFPVDVNHKSGFAGATGVPGNFNALLNVAGYGMDPLPIPVTQNKDLIEANGLRDRIRPEDEPWLKEIMRLFFGAAVPADLHIRKAASTGFPFFTTNNVYKKTATLSALHNVDRFLSLATGGESELTELLQKFHAIYLYAIQERQQPNAIIEKDGKLTSKPRTAPTELEARSGSYAGGTKADMTVHDEHGTVIENHFAMRRRDVFGLNGNLNYVMTAVMGCFRAVYLSRFAATYKTRGALDKQEKIDRFKFVVGSDVKTMDKMIPKWFSTYFFEELPRYLDERMVEVMRRSFGATYVVPPPWRRTGEDYDPVYGKSPLDPTGFDNHVGLPSGIAFNPDYGKLWMTFVYIILFKDSGALNSPSDIEPFLQGRNPEHGLMDMSDDAALLTNNSAVAAKLRVASSPYAVLEPEVPVIYLGDVFCEAEGRKRVYPNPLTYVINALCREDSIIKRENTIQSWANGAIARFTVYSPTPIFREMNALYEEECRRLVGVNPTLLARSLAKHQRMSSDDAQVLLNPAALYYKVDAKDVSKAVLDEVVATVPASDFWPYIKHLFKVPTVDYEEVSNG